MSLKRTPLYEAHLKYKGKMIGFGGWELPVQYTGIMKEHKMVREKAGIFDVSHMGEIGITGDNAEEFLQKLLTNDLAKLQDNQILYTFMCYPDGGVVDDLLVYRFTPTQYLLVVNAANLEKDLKWMEGNIIPGVELSNISDQYALIAVQGPLAQEILQKLTDFDLEKLQQFSFENSVKIANIECLVSRTGYTGEDGFEIYLAPDHAIDLWEQIIQAGENDIVPAGLGARDSLRFEAKLPLYGQEIDKDITPLEANLGFAVKLDKPDFIGKEALVKQKKSQPKRILIEFEMLERGIARTDYEVEKSGEKIGWVTSGAYSPTFNKSLGLALIKREFNQPGEEIDIIIRNKAIKAKIIKNSFYKRKKK